MGTKVFNATTLKLYGTTRLTTTMNKWRRPKTEKKRRRKRKRTKKNPKPPNGANKSCRKIPLSIFTTAVATRQKNKTTTKKTTMKTMPPTTNGIRTSFTPKKLTISALCAQLTTPKSTSLITAKNTCTTERRKGTHRIPFTTEKMEICLT